MRLCDISMQALQGNTLSFPGLSTETNIRGGKSFLEKRDSWKILAGSRNLEGVFDKSRSLVFAWFVFTFFRVSKLFTKESRAGIFN